MEMIAAREQPRLDQSGSWTIRQDLQVVEVPQIRVCRIGYRKRERQRCCPFVLAGF